MMTEHTKASTAFTITPYSNECAACHETKVDTFTGAWDATCAACHATTHTGQAGAHDASAIAAECNDCHNTSDVSTIHNNSIPTNAAVTTVRRATRATPRCPPRSTV